MINTIDPSAYRLMTKTQLRKFNRHGIIPAWVRLADRQLASAPLNRPPPDSKTRSSNPMENLWGGVSFKEMTE